MDNHLDPVESLEKSIDRLEELVHFCRLGGFKITKFVSNVTNLAERTDGCPQFNEPKFIVSCQKNPSHVLGKNWVHANKL